jgi:hexulose-6-phosphate isomerase
MFTARLPSIIFVLPAVRPRIPAKERSTVSTPLNRRQALRVGAGILVGAAAGSLRADEKKNRNIKKAIMYGTIGYKGTVLEKFKALKAAGFEGVEPNSHMDQKKVKAALEETGLKAASVCCDTHWGKPLSHPDVKIQREGVEGLIQSLKDAKFYGATSVLFVPGRVLKGQATYDECFARSVAGIKKALPMAQELGVKIAIENVWNDFITTPQQAMSLLEAINSPMVGWHFDVGNAIRYGPSEKWIPVLGKHILKLHIKEYSNLKSFNVKLLEGDDHWPAIMKALDEVGYEGWGISEQPGAQAKDEESMQDLSKRMDKVFAS